MVKAFGSAAVIGDFVGAPSMVAFQLSIASVCGLVAVALALEHRDALG